MVQCILYVFSSLIGYNFNVETDSGRGACHALAPDHVKYLMLPMRGKMKI